MLLLGNAWPPSEMFHSGPTLNSFIAAWFVVTLLTCSYCPTGCRIRLVLLSALVYRWQFIWPGRWEHEASRSAASSRRHPSVHKVLTGAPSYSAGVLRGFGQAAGQEAKSLLLSIGELDFLSKLLLVLVVVCGLFESTADRVDKGLVSDTLAHASVQELFIFLLACTVGYRSLEILIKRIVVGAVLQQEIDDLISVLLLFGVCVLAGFHAS